MAKISTTDLKRVAFLSSNAAGNVKLKDEYQKLGRKILKSIAECLGLKKDEYDIRWNPGGIAVSGDHILHTDKLYLAFHDNLGMGWFYFRTCNGRKDYSGGRNHNYTWTTLMTLGLDRLVKLLRVVQDGFYTCPSSGDKILNIKMVESILDKLRFSSA